MRVRSYVLLAVSAAALALSGCAAGPMPHNGMGVVTRSASTPSSATESSGTSATAYQAPQEFVSSAGQLDVTLTAKETQVPYGNGTRWAMTYDGTAPGPTLRVRPGDTVRLTLVNDLSEPTNLHTHGLHVSPDADNPFLMIEPGERHVYTYTIPADTQPGTFWYHPHEHGRVAPQVAAGLSGTLIVEGDADAGLSEAATDNVLVLTDPPLTSTNPWPYAGSDAGDAGDMNGMDMNGMDMNGMDMNGGVSMMTAMRGRAGPTLLTNGTAAVTLPATGGKLERVRVVNATPSSRIVLTYSGSQMLRLASEGGRLAAPEPASSVELAPGERTELVLLRSPDGGELLGQRLSNEAGSVPLEDPAAIAAISPDAGTDATRLPASLGGSTRDLFAPDVAVAERRTIDLEGHMQSTIDGKLFEPGRVDFTAKVGTVQEWVIRNNTPMYHPIHLHTWSFQVAGEEGWQDVVTVAPHSEAVIRIAFDDFGGSTVLHCHILDHEDAGMMSIVQVT